MALIDQINALATRIAQEINKRGIIRGGAVNSALLKNSTTDFDMKWVSLVGTQYTLGYGGTTNSTTASTTRIAKYIDRAFGNVDINVGSGGATAGGVLLTGLPSPLQDLNPSFPLVTGNSSIIWVYVNNSGQLCTVPALSANTRLAGPIQYQTN